MRPLRKVLVVGFLATAVPVAGASLAAACTSLATLSFNATGAAPGATVTGTGKGFNGGGHGVDNVRTPVVFHWQTRNGPVLTTATPPDSTGVISYSFTIPATAAVGQYVVIGVQNDPATNVPYYGTPARQAVAVTAAGSRVASSTAAEVAPAPAAATAAPIDGAAVASVATATPAAVAAATASVAAAPTVNVAAPAASAPVSAREAVASPNAATAAPEAGMTPANGPSSSAVSASAIAPGLETTTPGLLPIASDSGRSVTPALLLLVVGMLLALAAAARWLTSRVPGVRHTATA